MDLELEFLFFGFHSRVVEGTRPRGLRWLSKSLEWILLGASLSLALILLHLHWSFVNQPGCIQSLLQRENLTSTNFTILEIHIPTWGSDFMRPFRQELMEIKQAFEEEQRQFQLAHQETELYWFAEAEEFLLNSFLSNELSENLNALVFGDHEEDKEGQVAPTTAEGATSEGSGTPENLVEAKEGSEAGPSTSDAEGQTLKRFLLFTEDAKDEGDDAETHESLLGLRIDLVDELLKVVDLETKFRISEYSGFLRVPAHLHEQHNITVKSFVLDPHDQCFGGWYTQTLLKYFVGYETAMFNAASFVYGGNGFFYTKQTRETFNIALTISSGIGHPLSENDALDSVALQLEAVVNSAFLFYSVTGAVTLIFQGTQLRMLRAYMSMLQLLRSHLPVTRFFVENTLQTMVNMMLLMATMLFATQFTDDSIIGFFVVFLGWCAELFTICSARTATTLRYWPKYFLLSQISFYLYHFTVPYGFSWLALALSIIFTQYAMFYFFNNCEIPAYEMAHITPSRPRAIAFFGPHPATQAARQPQQQPQPQPQQQQQPQPQPQPQPATPAAEPIQPAPASPGALLERADIPEGDALVDQS